MNITVDQIQQVLQNNESLRFQFLLQVAENQIAELQAKIKELEVLLAPPTDVAAEPVADNVVDIPQPSETSTQTEETQ